MGNKRKIIARKYEKEIIGVIIKLKKGVNKFIVLFQVTKVGIDIKKQLKCNINIFLKLFFLYGILKK